MFFGCWLYSGFAHADQRKRWSVRLLGRGWSGTGPDLGTLGRGAAGDACLGGRRTRDIARAHSVPVRCGDMLETGIGRAALAALPGSHRRSP